MQDFFACGSSVPVRVEREGGTAAWLAGPVAAPSVQGHDCLRHRSYGPLRVFSRASCSWRSEGHFGQSFSIAPAVQVLKGLPCLGSFSVVQHVRHIEGAPLVGVLLCISAYQSLKGAPWMESCSVVQCVRHLIGQPLYCSAAGAGVWGERGYGDGFAPYS